MVKSVNRVFALMVTALLLSPGYAFADGGMADKIVRFSSSGPDRYADGSIVEDGECYALVWSPAGRVFSGFNADGTAVSPDDRVVLAGALAEGGKCRDALFQIPAAEYAELEGGEWAVCLVDTRNVYGVPVGVQDGKPLRVNRWGVVNSGAKIEPEEVSKLTVASLRPAGGTRSSLSASVSQSGSSVAASARATRLSAVPPSIVPPKITAMEISDDEVVLAVEDTVPYLSYTIVSGAEPGKLKEDYFADVVDGEDGKEIVIGTDRTANRRFFKVTRAEE